MRENICVKFHRNCNVKNKLGIIMFKLKYIELRFYIKDDIMLIMKKIENVIKIVILAIVLSCIASISFGSNQLNSDAIANSRINEIRNTKNTDISKRTGKVYYISADGNDSNDGLSPENAWNTLAKANSEFMKKNIKATDTILLKRGDIFRGYFDVRANDILLGCFGDEALAKPEILVSPLDGGKIGEWTEIKTNIWKYTVDGENFFKEDVGVIWFYSENEECFGQKIITTEDVDDKNLDITTILNNDLEFYHCGHPYANSARGEELYLYSNGNPKERFEKIEFCIAKSGIRLWNYTNLIVDNLTIKYAGVHGIAAGTLANLMVTNCEFRYIGGCTQNYNNNRFVRYGNAIEIYGSVQPTNGYEVEDGYIVRNNYIYQVYDAGITFQITTDKPSIIENVIFDNNIIEYCNYSIEYWNNCTSDEEELQNNTYINNYEITNNIMRYAGFGVSQTRTDKKQSAHIKTWKHYKDNFVKGKYVIENNIFDNANEQVFYVSAVNEKSLPILKNNTFYNNTEVPFGYMYVSNKIQIPYNIEELEKEYITNRFKDLSIKSYELGDVDQDGEISVNDLAIVKLHLIEKQQLTNDRFNLADVDKDMRITINDFAILKLMLVCCD